jgi:MFS transporter, DHA1 family, multidrug resistance protein
MSGDAAPRALRRERSTLLAATFASGPYELVDFILPLFAGAALGASATEVGILAAVEMAVSVVVRPVAGVLADTRERRYVAAAGAFVYALSLAGYAYAPGMAVAYAAAVLGGIGGALFFVAVRSIIGERLAEDSAVYPKLLSAEETGSWIAFVAGMTLIAVIDYRGVFLGAGAACVVAGLVLLSSPSRAARDLSGEGRLGLGAVGRALRPMLLAVVITMAAESAVALLLLLHLQRGFDLEVNYIALVFLPGAIAMSVLPPYLHRFVRRFGRTRVLAVASVSSAAFAATLAWAPNPYVVAGLWIFSGAAWAAVIPIQQAVIAEASGERVGRGMGLYESAGLLGGLVGSLAAGLLYDGSSWEVACLVAAVVIASGAVVVPRAVRRLGVPDIPVETAPDAAGAVPGTPVGPAGAPDLATPGLATRDLATTPGLAAPDLATRDLATTPGLAAPDLATTPGLAAAEPAAPGTAVEPAASRAGTEATASGTADEKPPKTPRRLLVELGQHAALYAGAQVVLALIGLSWLLDTVTGRDADHDGLAGVAHGAGRVWTVILVIDVLWTAWKVYDARRRAES